MRAGGVEAVGGRGVPIALGMVLVGLAACGSGSSALARCAGWRRASQTQRAAFVRARANQAGEAQVQRIRAAVDSTCAGAAPGTRGDDVANDISDALTR